MSRFARKFFTVMFAAVALGAAAIAGAGVSPAEATTVVRDHRTQPTVRDHRAQPVVRDHRKPAGTSSGGVTVTNSPRGRGCSVARCPSADRGTRGKCVLVNSRYKCP